MKKFCSECGHPLEISKKFCSDCGTPNPFFSISHEIPSARASAIDTLRARKESIERELEEIEREQKEVQRKEKLRMEMEELERQRMVRLEKEKEIKEKFEREGLEAVLKKEIDQVKAETEQYKHQTHELLKELKGVVLQIDEENRKLKEEVQQIAKTQVIVTPAVPPRIAVMEKEPEVLTTDSKPEFSTTDIYNTETNSQPSDEIEEATGSSWKTGVGILLGLISIGAGAFLYSNYKPGAPTASATEAVTEVATTSPQPETSNTVEPQLQIDAATVSTEKQTPAVDADEGKVVADKTTLVANKKETKTYPAAENKPEKETAYFVLNEEKAKGDLIGKNLSGCGIVLSGSSEIQSITSPVLVEDATTSGYIKYKLNLKLVQGGETYNVTPYLYYSPSGKFIKIDASNCE